jgi:hypothetical protein
MAFERLLTLALRPASCWPESRATVVVDPPAPLSSAACPALLSLGLFALQSPASSVVFGGQLGRPQPPVVNNQHTPTIAVSSLATKFINDLIGTD